MPPNTKVCFWKCDDHTRTFESMVRANSDHPGGVDVPLLYGSVRFVKNTISPTPWWAHGTYSGGEVASADSLGPRTRPPSRRHRR